MADIVVVPANVIAGANAKKETKKMAAGATGLQGKVVYKNTNTDLLLAQADAAATAEIAGVLLNAASPGQPAEIITEGDLNPGVAVVPGTYYVLSAAAAGGIAPIADLASTELARGIGFATTTSNIYVQINNNGGIVP